ncbi:cytochrome b/b6 domain-containing protein [Pseudanabaena sp. ABRG5-3]|uniref:cytochrome b/b6 domain-containing protein n=1 Tax=Pseudanabaena sp. ABRG5-3 TaxID=685565 RepID=UPI000DC6E544|nr:cytochrome b/b6 domain-containing protein [Pseudanabaena sp. ABRG5-3]BBC22597.1 thiosulfate reductase cytochrome b subunit [Pseudanabaena sp. ABRG5-3]
MSPKSANPKSPTAPKQAIFIKAFHTINLIALILMTASGLQIYNANPVFGGRAGWRFPKEMLLGGWLGGGRNWHFASMWVFSMSLLIYGIYIFLTRRWKHRFASEKDLQALQAKNPKRKNYAWHRIAYTAIIPILLLAILSGLCMYKPVQFAWISGLFGSWQNLRIAHFLTVPIVLIFAIAHIFLSFKVGGFKMIRSMFV